jgi:murein DD-endopeptidase MepM/ murein hydrolase activator NlpD
VKISIKKRAFILFACCFCIRYFCAAQTIKCAVFPENPRPGEIVTVAVLGEASQAVLLADGKERTRAKLFTVPADDGRPDFLAAVFIIPSNINPVNTIIRIENNGVNAGEMPIQINERHFESEIIELNQELTDLRTVPDPQKTLESNKLWSIITTIGTEIYHYNAFILPVTSTRRTSLYGTRRVFQYSNGSRDVSVHAGVDFGVPTGTQVISCGAGRVILARYRIVTGNSVIIEHLPGVYSLYYHLDKINVQEDTYVQTGALLGLSGSTGLATGPHLHWEIRVNGENADPDAFTARHILDKSSIFSIFDIKPDRKDSRLVK